VLGSICAATPSYADSGVQHLAFEYAEEPVVTSVDGLGVGCPDFTGTLEEDRYLKASGILKRDGTGHATSDVVATVELTPDASSAVSYTGSYAEHQAGFFADDGHGDRVVTTTTHGVLEGSDGSTWRIQEVAHLAVDARGTVRVWFDDLRCTG
jgi:hypothetical protein